MAIATAYRVSELHALARGQDTLRWNQNGSVSLATKCGFIAKNRRPTAAGQSTTLQPLLEEPRLCPVAHLRHYMAVTDAAEGSDHLFRSPRDPGGRTTPQVLSAWITQVIKRAYAHQEENGKSTNTVLLNTTHHRGDREWFLSDVLLYFTGLRCIQSQILYDISPQERLTPLCRLIGILMEWVGTEFLLATRNQPGCKRSITTTGNEFQLVTRNQPGLLMI
jgi:hypothetical protein